VTAEEMRAKCEAIARECERLWTFDSKSAAKVIADEIAALTSDDVKDDDDHRWHHGDAPIT
jgi:hypothetical protein